MCSEIVKINIFYIKCEQWYIEPMCFLNSSVIDDVTLHCNTLGENYPNHRYTVFSILASHARRRTRGPNHQQTPRAKPRAPEPRVLSVWPPRGRGGGPQAQEGGQGGDGRGGDRARSPFGSWILEPYLHRVSWLLHLKISWSSRGIPSNPSGSRNFN